VIFLFMLVWLPCKSFLNKWILDSDDAIAENVSLAPVIADNASPNLVVKAAEEMGWRIHPPDWMKSKMGRGSWTDLSSPESDGHGDLPETPDYVHGGASSRASASESSTRALRREHGH
jgi:hypothetical protein